MLLLGFRAAQASGDRLALAGAACENGGGDRTKLVPAGELMDERQFYDEKEETKQIPLTCPHCRQENTFPVRWMVRTKKAQPPRGGNEEDRAKFAKARSYMVRIDNMVACRNIKCRKRFDLTGQTVFLI